MRNIIIFSLEPLESRYTCEWHTYLPKLLKDAAGDEFNIIQIDGDTNSGTPTHGAFLDFLSTNQWKNEQANKFFNLVKDGIILKGDRILFTDFWNPTILEIKYVNDLMSMDWELHAFVHAGSYDSQDFLGRLIKDKNWTYSTERALFHAIDHNWFATQYHVDLFVKSIVGHENYFKHASTGKISLTGWPMDYLPDTLSKYDILQKEDIIIFPHRIAPEKQPEIFRDLATSMPQYKFVVCQDDKLSKQEYHKLLAKSKVVWSANLQETLGISPFEGALMGAIPLLPFRLSYFEMYEPIFLYPTEWTESFENYLENKEDIMYKIEYLMKNYEEIRASVDNLADHLLEKYFTATELINKLLRK